MQKKQPTNPPFEVDKKTKPSAIAGKHGIGFSTARHLARQGMKKAMEKQPVKEGNNDYKDRYESTERDMLSIPGSKDELKHRVSVTVSDPHHTMVSKRKEKIEKRVRLYANDEEHAVALAKIHFKRQGYRVHDAYHIGITEATVNTADIEKKKNITPEDKRTIGKVADLMAKERQLRAAQQKEEVEQVDELSNELLQRYKKEAGKQVDEPSTPPSIKYKRGSGHLLATVKQMKSGKPMPKEEVEMNEAVTVKKANYSWGKMMTVHHGSETSYPLHPEHQAAIRKLKSGESTSFTDETNRKVTASREGDMVHLSGRGTNKKTTVAHSHFTEGFDFKQFRKSIIEKTLTPAEMKKREEVAKAIERENPKMPMAMKMAIATKTAKRVAEETDDEGKMAKGQLMRMVNQASALAQMMDDDKQLDGWVQSKLTMASDYLDSVHDYLMHNKQDVDGDEMEEGVHYCAKHVRSSLLGDGVVLEAQHADPDKEGQIEWYMVEFKDGIHKVYTEDLEIMFAEYHCNHKKKKRMTNG